MFICFAYVVPAPLLYRIINKEAVRHYAWNPLLASQGVLWLMSTREQIFDGYEVLYAPNDNVGVNIPATQCFYVGLVRDLFPQMKAVADLINIAGCAMELWAGSNMAMGGIDLYHRMIYKNIPPSDRYAHFVILDAGTDPTRWYWGRRMEGRGVYDCGHVLRGRL